MINKIMNKVTLLKGDCLQKLKELKDNSVDSIVTDPPYEIGFMGKGWDDSGIANNPELWKEVLRVLKPGGHLLSFSHSRTYHRQAVAVEDAGFEIRDQIMWIYGSGFPKSHNIGKAVDKINGIEIEKGDKFNVVGGKTESNGGSKFRSDHPDYVKYEAQNDYDGWGTALKPAHEPIVMARKPFKGNVANNVLEWGTGGINVDGCRVATNDKLGREFKVGGQTLGAGQYGVNDGRKTKPTNKLEGTYHDNTNGLGRFPANIIFDEEAGKILDEQSGVSKSTKGNPRNVKEQSYFGGGIKNENNEYNDIGGASRFFYCPKSSKKDRNEGNIHPTVKPTDLMAYLIRLVTPKGGIVLDPFMGSGSTGKAAVREGMNFIGIERETEYMEIAKSRIEYEQKKNKHQDFFDI
jgi:DNA modification methylase